MVQNKAERKYQVKKKCQPLTFVSSAGRERGTCSAYCWWLDRSLRNQTNEHKQKFTWLQLARRQASSLGLDSSCVVLRVTLDQGANRFGEFSRMLSEPIAFPMKKTIRRSLSITKTANFQSSETLKQKFDKVLSIGFLEEQTARPIGTRTEQKDN